MPWSTQKPLVAQLRHRAAVAVVTVAAVVALGVISARHAVDAFDRRRADPVSAAFEDLTDWAAIDRGWRSQEASVRRYLGAIDQALPVDNQRPIADAIARLRARHSVSDPIAHLDNVAEQIRRFDHIVELALAAPVRSPASALEHWERDSHLVSLAISQAIEESSHTDSVRRSAVRDRAIVSTSRSLTLALIFGGAALLGVIGLAILFARTAIRVVRHNETDQEQTMFHLLDQLPVGVLVITPDGKPWFANQSAHQMLGPSAGRDDLDAETLSSAYAVYQAGTDSIYPMERAPLTRALAGEVADVSDMELHRGDEVVPLHVYGSPIRNRQGDIAFAVATFQNVHTLHRAAHEDALTGLPNRLAATHVYNRELLRCARSDRPLAVAILDLDRFKAINDSYGHAMGDEVLRRAGAAITRVLRKTDLIARWGGEELVVLLPETDVVAAEYTITRTLDSVMAESFVARDGRRFWISFSAGVVTADGGESIDAAVDRADVLLYAAKKAGRARVFAEMNPSGVPGAATGVRSTVAAGQAA